jgi:hypothetical protein
MMRKAVRRIELLLLSLLAAGAGAPSLLPAQAAPPPLSLEASLTKARVEGKYSMLLRQFKVEEDAKTYGDFKDLGPSNRMEYAGQTDLPAGHWVYVKPYWYIWRDLAAVQRPKRPWGPEQATGEPDTDQSGDIQTAWASASPDDQDEWLMLEYAEPIIPIAVDVYETFNPGALNRITVFKLDGEEVEVWKGDDPTPAGSDKGVSSVPIKVNFKTNRIKLYIASKSVPGWNEIDAVGLKDKNRTYWAVAAEASSTYAQIMPQGAPEAAVLLDVAARQAEQIRRLEKEVRDLKQQVEQLRALKDEIEELKKQLKKDK